MWNPFRRKRGWYVRLSYDDGTHSMVGPMKSYFAADFYLQVHLNPHPFDRTYRKVASARIVAP